MADLAAIESAIVIRLDDAEFNSDKLFALRAGASGPVRPALRQRLLRERMPAAYVVFLNELLDPATPLADQGPRFAILLAARCLRPGGNPRHGIPEHAGVFDAIDATRTLLDDFESVAGTQMVPLAQHMLESDDRHAIAQITYLVKPA